MIRAILSTALLLASLAANALNVLIVSGTPTTDADAISTLLTGRSDTTTIVDDGAIPGDVSAYDAIVVVESAVSTATTLLATTKGTVLLGSQEWTAYNLCSATSAGAGQTQIEIKSTAHAISVDMGWSTLDALITITASSSSAERCNPSSLAAGATRIADDSTGTDARVVLLAADTGAALTTGNAAGRRVGWGHAVPSVWNTTANDVFFAAVDWAADNGGGGSNVPTIFRHLRQMKQ